MRFTHVIPSCSCGGDTKGNSEWGDRIGATPEEREALNDVLYLMGGVCRPVEVGILLRLLSILDKDCSRNGL